MEEVESYPGNIAKLREMAEQGDRNAAWLLRKIEASEILRALELIRNADDERIWDIAEALVGIRQKAEGETERPHDNISDIEKEIVAELKEVYEKLKKVMLKVRYFVY